MMPTSGLPTTALDDAVIRSATNTLRVWRTRRLTRGRTVVHSDILHRIAELWPTIPPAEAERIALGVPR